MDDKQYGTRDFYLAATLITLGMELIGLERSNPQRVTFVFRDHPERREWGRMYFAGKLSVNPLNFIAAIKALKGELYA